MILLLKTKQDQTSEWIDDKNTEQIENYNDMIVRSFKETIKELQTDLGENIDDWQWEKLHTLTMKHPLSAVKILDKVFKLNRGPFGMPGIYTMQHTELRIDTFMI